MWFHLLLSRIAVATSKSDNIIPGLIILPSKVMEICMDDDFSSSRIVPP